MLPPESESFKEHNPDFTLEESGTVAAYRSKSPTKKNSRGYPNPVYSEPQNEFIFGNICYEGGTMRLKLEMEVKYMGSLAPAGHIWVGVVPSEVTPEHARRIHFVILDRIFMAGDWIAVTMVLKCLLKPAIVHGTIQILLQLKLF
jgi:hypothetical protein